METKPWRADYSLDAKIVRRILRTQFPNLPAESVEYLHEGWDSSVYLVNAEWAFRFPKRAEVESWLQGELRSLELLRRVPLTIRIPEPEFLGHPDPLFPAMFMGYRWIPGTPGDRFDAQRVSHVQCARQLGVFLSTLHSVDPVSIDQLNLRRYDDALDRLFDEVRAMRDTVFAHLPPWLGAVCQISWNLGRSSPRAVP